MRDLSDAVAAEALIRDAADEVGGPMLRFRPHTAWIGAVGFGSWGTVIVVPLSLLIASGDVPIREAAPVLAIASIGFALWYVALRTIVNRARLELDGGELVFRRGPLWPWRERRWRIGEIATARAEIHPDTFRHPAMVRGYPAARPYIVRVTMHDRREVTLPLALGSRDASDVAAWIARACGSR